MAVNEPVASHTVPQLGCGRSIDHVWDRIDQPPDAHERQCAECQAARASLARLRLATDELRTSPAATPSVGVKDAVMAVARAEVRRGRRLTIRADDAGTLAISEQTVAAVVREAADRVVGAHARRCVIRLDVDDDRTVIPEAGVRQIDVSLGVALSASRPVPAQLAELRATIRDEVRDRLGVAVARIDLTVEDLYDIEPQAGLRIRRAS